MCAISGIYNLNRESVNKNLIEKMTKTMIHRGPDDEGFYIKNNIGLGHCRLSIIDLSKAGHQPMTNEDMSLWIIHNGEIYNFPELKKELQKLGHTFRSNTDTEVILHSYEEWGVECLNKFNGMWAFAIWDEKKKQLFCSRDRFGIKPFYYFFDGKIFTFASEIKALLLCPFVKTEPNNPLIFDYLALNFKAPGEETFFKNIKQLRQGHYLILAENNFKIKRYYQLSFNPKLGKFKEKECEEYAQRFLELLKDSVKLRLRSDVPVGSCLSGGIDSSTIVCLINELLKEGGINEKVVGEKQKTFSSCFEDLRFDEREYIKKIIEKINVNPHYVFPSGDKLWQEIDNLIWHQEEPFCSTSIYAQWNIMKLAKENNVKVLLDGQGGDELLAGYSGSVGSYFNQLILNGRIFSFLKELQNFQKVSQWSLKELLFQPLREWAMFFPQKLRLFLRKRYISPDFKLLNPDFLKKYQTERESIRAKERSKINLQKRLWESEVESGLDELLRYEDKNSMAFSVESRVPFVDYRLVEFVFSLPAVYKIHNGWRKYLLRVATKDLLPEEIRWRRDKMGFVTPEMAWLNNNKEKIREIFRAKDLKSTDFINQKELLDSVDYFLNKRDVNTSELWKFINLELWLRKFF